MKKKTETANSNKDMNAMVINASISINGRNN